MPVQLIPHARDFRGIENKLKENRWEEDLSECDGPQADCLALSGLSARIRRPIMICRQLGAGTLVNPIGGRELYDPALFRAHGIDLYFVQHRPTVYTQKFSNSFHPDLSVLDVLFNCSVDQVRDMLTAYTLIQ